VALFVLAVFVVQSTMGKKKDKQKEKARLEKQERKVSRQDLEQEILRLRSQTEQLQARLERIAEIAASGVDAGEADGFEPEKLTA
jgi:uncharacterized protein YoaH (UPF0181 family)